MGARHAKGVIPVLAGTQSNATKGNTLARGRLVVRRARMGHILTKRALPCVRLRSAGGTPLGPTQETTRGRLNRKNVAKDTTAWQVALAKNVQPVLIVILRPHANLLCVNLEGFRIRKVPVIAQSAPQEHMSIGTDRHRVVNVVLGASKVQPARRIVKLAQSKPGVSDSILFKHKFLRIAGAAGGQGKILVTSNPGSKSAQQCRAFGLGDPAPLPGVCVDSAVTQNQLICPATTGPVPTGLLKRSVPRGCSNRRHTMCEVKSGRGGWECIDTKITLDACGSCDNDCSSIPYVGDVKCLAGKCQVVTCREGFSVQYVDGVPSCIPVTKKAFLIFERDMNLAN
ncbi:unnamed protein product [Rhizoctonia solani]|uniref:Protein CPL1-like domain-containing protein n=1 Tax=Rhizoctonia solani TaxID=456999 RepID=A0A8H3EDF9_9AGAM|nr:unnamed protein product [Rhizoctonia solani]